MHVHVPLCVQVHAYVLVAYRFQAVAVVSVCSQRSSGRLVERPLCLGSNWKLLFLGTMHLKDDICNVFWLRLLRVDCMVSSCD